MPDADPKNRSGLRRRAAEARATIVGTRGLRARVPEHASALRAHRRRLDALQQHLERASERLRDLERRLKEVERATAHDTLERANRDTQLGALELRLGELEQCVADARGGLASAPVDADQLAEGSRLLAEVRTEHARVRARMQVVSAYEERLRRVEESVAQLFEGDQRHLV